MLASAGRQRINERSSGAVCRPIRWQVFEQGLHLPWALEALADATVAATVHSCHRGFDWDALPPPPVVPKHRIPGCYRALKQSKSLWTRRTWTPRARARVMATTTHASSGNTCANKYNIRPGLLSFIQGLSPRGNT